MRGKDPERKLDDVMSYAKKKIGDFTGTTKEELIDYIKRSDEQNRISRTFRDIITDTNRAEQLLKNNKETLKEKAVQAELRRKIIARTTDEAKTAKRVTTINKETLTSWKKNPGKFDLRGIDTATHTFIKDEINKRLRAAKAKGYKVGMKGVEPYRKEKGETRRSLITGQFLKIR